MILSDRMSGCYSSIASYSYDELERLAQKWLHRRIDEISDIKQKQFGLTEKEMRTGGAASFFKTRRLVRRRKFQEFRNFISPKNEIQRSFLELFCTSRLHMYVVAYLIIQEGHGWDKSAAGDKHTTKLIQYILARLGKSSALRFKIKVGPISIGAYYDPTLSLRRSYKYFLAAKNAPSIVKFIFNILARIYNLSFKIRCLMFRSVVKGMTQCWYESPSKPTWLDKEFQDHTVQTARLLISKVFPTSVSLTSSEWDDLSRRLISYFSDRLPILLKIVANDPDTAIGLAKMVKLALGVIVGRVQCRCNHEESEVDFIFNSIRIAYSWGATYPLVDDVLDKGSTNTYQRSELVEVISSCLFGALPTPVHSHAADLLSEVTACITEVVYFMPKERKNDIKNLISLLLAAHERDAKRRLQHNNTLSLRHTEEDIWVDNILKAALVRIVTAEIGGSHIYLSELDSYFTRALLNQLGDDLWDIDEDLENNRATPFTLFLTDPGSLDPYKTYFLHGIDASSGCSVICQIAAVIGMQETSRCLFQSKLMMHPIYGPVSKNEILNNLRILGFTDDIGDIYTMPHIDLDAVMFGLAVALEREI